MQDFLHLEQSVVLLPPSLLRAPLTSSEFHIVAILWLVQLARIFFGYGLFELYIGTFLYSDTSGRPPIFRIFQRSAGGRMAFDTGPICTWQAPPDVRTWKRPGFPFPRLVWLASSLWGAGLRIELSVSFCHCLWTKESREPSAPKWRQFSLSSVGRLNSSKLHPLLFDCRRESIENGTHIRSRVQAQACWKTESCR